MNVVDFSAWLEYFGDGPSASVFAKAVESSDELVVPALTLVEVLRLMSCPRMGSIILATAGSKDAVLWTQDAHFDGLEKVEFREKQENGD